MKKFILFQNGLYLELIVLLIGVSIVLSTGGTIGAFNNPTIVSILPSSQAVESGDTFHVSIWIYPGEPITGISFSYLYFNATLIHAENFMYDYFFDPYPIFPPTTTIIDNVNGYIGPFWMCICGPGSVTGNGSFVTIEFISQNVDGVSLLEIDGVEIINENEEVVSTTINNGSVTIATKPVISDVTLTTSEPLDTEPSFGWENFTCTVTDNDGVDEVKLILIGDMIVEYTMTKEGNIYYYNTTIETAYEYTYYVWANDTNDNFAESPSYIFDLQINEDITMDGSIGFVDIMSIAGKWMWTGPEGWIREDVNNDGSIGFVDIMSVAGMWGQEW